MKYMMGILENNKGTATSDLLLFVLIVIFVIIPLFSFILEQYILLLKEQAIKDAIDMTNLAAYNALEVADKSETKITANAEDIKKYYEPLLALNMNLNSDLTPKDNSIAGGKVKIVDVTVYPKGTSFPVSCAEGRLISRPSVHSVIKIPIKPELYWNIYRFLTGRSGNGIREYNIHVDTELPYNNPD